MKLPLLVIIFSSSGTAAQSDYTEHFDNGVNLGGWSFGAPAESVVATGGVITPPFFQGTGLVAAIPALRSALSPSSPFTGNYRQRRLALFSVYLKIVSPAVSGNEFRPALMLISANGTPSDPSDDWGAFTVTFPTLAPSGIWALVDFHVPFDSGSFPSGWATLALGPNAPALPQWGDLITQVDRVAIYLADPRLVFPERTWTLAADAITISSRACYPNCDGSTITPWLNVNDFVCFNNRFAAGDPRANCDRSTTPPSLNVNDFICFNEVFAAGCSAP